MIETKIEKHKWRKWTCRKKNDLLLAHRRRKSVPSSYKAAHNNSAQLELMNRLLQLQFTKRIYIQNRMVVAIVASGWNCFKHYSWFHFIERLHRNSTAQHNCGNSSRLYNKKSVLCICMLCMAWREVRERNGGIRVKVKLCMNWKWPWKKVARAHTNTQTNTDTRWMAWNWLNVDLEVIWQDLYMFCSRHHIMKYNEKKKNNNIIVQTRFIFIVVIPLLRCVFEIEPITCRKKKHHTNTHNNIYINMNSTHANI